MTDRLDTLRAIERDPTELARALGDVVRAWASALARREKAPRRRLQATGEAAARLRCPVARRVIEKTEKHWSGK